MITPSNEKDEKKYISTPKYLQLYEYNYIPHFNLFYDLLVIFIQWENTENRHQYYISKTTSYYLYLMYIDLIELSWKLS